MSGNVYIGIHPGRLQPRVCRIRCLLLEQLRFANCGVPVLCGKHQRLVQHRHRRVRLTPGENLDPVYLSIEKFRRNLGAVHKAEGGVELQRVALPRKDTPVGSREVNDRAVNGHSGVCWTISNAGPSGHLSPWGHHEVGAELLRAGDPGVRCTDPLLRKDIARPTVDESDVVLFTVPELRRQGTQESHISGTELLSRKFVAEDIAGEGGDCFTVDHEVEDRRSLIGVRLVHPTADPVGLVIDNLELHRPAIS